eukprot:TRINITY_DN9347_c0_g1_i2.p1 TRINITY_DN9347_c0_g1~~TRINITY_DN9347_c0_g1_i2.p1  ORF type:complete len:292 (-),score=75.48 TRINITY_DN9347_c0_g1_i2:24-899(-)
MLVRGLLSSSGTIFYTFTLMFILLYISACLCVEMITKPNAGTDDEVMADIVSNYWSDIPTIMLTLVSFVTFDSISGIYRPMISSQPYLLCFFMPFLLIVSVAMMNLVTAVIVEGAIEQSKLDREVQEEYKRQQIKAMIPSLVKLFHELDEDCNGTLTLEELHASDDDLREELMTYMNAENLVELFEMIDVDASGEVNIEEFCEGISKIASSEQPVEFLRILKQLKTVRETQLKQDAAVQGQLADLAKTQRKVEERLVQIQEQQRVAQAGMEARLEAWIQRLERGQPHHVLR